jgi:hypothetical protein
LHAIRQPVERPLHGLEIDCSGAHLRLQLLQGHAHSLLVNLPLYTDLQVVHTLDPRQ